MTSPATESARENRPASAPPPVPAGVAERGFPVEITVRSGPARRFVLELGVRDLRRVRSPRPADHGLKVEVDGDLLEAVRSGRTTGTAAVMTGHVSARGDWSAVSRVAPGVTSGPFFRAWCQAAAPRPLRPAAGDVGDEAPIVAVLGSTNDERGHLSPMAVERLTAAIRLTRANPRARLVLTGGFGTHSNPGPLPHWRHAVDFLAERGIPADAVHAVVNSRHTYEDILLLREIAHEHRPASITVVTSDFHATRVRAVLDLVLPAARVHPAPSRTVPRATLTAVREHDREAFGKTIIAAAVFGPDRLRGEAVSADLGWTTCWTPL